MQLTAVAESARQCEGKVAAVRPEGKIVRPAGDRNGILLTIRLNTKDARISQRIDFEIGSPTIVRPRQEVTVRISDRLRDGSSICIQIKNRLPIRTIQFNGHMFSHRRRKGVE